MTWKELKDKISLMTEEEQRQEVAVWGENMNLMKDCSLEKTDEDMYYNSEWDYTCEESELEPEDKNDPDVHKVYEAGMYYIWDLDKCDENGNLYGQGDIPCPFCNTEKFIEYDPFSKEDEFYEGIENEEKAKEKSREWYLNWINYMREQIK